MTDPSVVGNAVDVNGSGSRSCLVGTAPDKELITSNNAGGVDSNRSRCALSPYFGDCVQNKDLATERCIVVRASSVHNDQRAVITYCANNRIVSEM